MITRASLVGLTASALFAAFAASCVDAGEGEREGEGEGEGEDITPLPECSDDADCSDDLVCRVVDQGECFGCDVCSTCEVRAAAGEQCDARGDGPCDFVL